MILLIQTQRLDAHVLALDVAGLPLGRQLSLQRQQLGDPDLWTVDGWAAFAACRDGLLTGAAAGANLLMLETDICISVSAARELHARTSACAKAVRFTSSIVSPDGGTSQHDVLALCVHHGLVSSLVQSCDQQATGFSLLEISQTLPGQVEMSVAEFTGDAPPLRLSGMTTIAAFERAIQDRKAVQAMQAGVRIRDPQTVAIRGDLTCGVDVEIDRNVLIEGSVTLGDGVRIGANAIVRNTTIGAHSVVHPFSLVDGALIGERTFIGPYGRVRPDSTIGDAVQIGNFVEIKKSEIGDGSRINHLAFVGDATLGTAVTLGAGTITCNHDGVTSQRTHIAANAYVGSGSQLVAPIHIGEGAVIAAGSTITQDAPAGKLTLARSRQVTVAKRDDGVPESRGE